MSQNNNQLQHSFGSSSSLSSVNGSGNNSMNTTFDLNNASKAVLPSLDSAKGFNSSQASPGQAQCANKEINYRSDLAAPLTQSPSSIQPALSNQKASLLRILLLQQYDKLGLGVMLSNKLRAAGLGQIHPNELREAFAEVTIWNAIDSKCSSEVQSLNALEMKDYVASLCKKLVISSIIRIETDFAIHGISSLELVDRFSLSYDDVKKLDSHPISAEMDRKYKALLSSASLIFNRLDNSDSTVVGNIQVECLAFALHLTLQIGDHWIDSDFSLELIAEFGKRATRESFIKLGSLLVLQGNGKTSSAEALLLALDLVPNSSPQSEGNQESILEIFSNEIEKTIKEINDNGHRGSERARGSLRVLPSTSISSTPSSPSSPSASEVSLASADAQLQHEDLGRVEGNFGMSTRPTVTIRDMKTPYLPSYTLVGPTSQKVIPNPKTIGSSSSSRTISQAPSTSRLLGREYTLSSILNRNPQFGSKNQRYGSLPTYHYVPLPTKTVFSGPRDMKISRRELKLDGWTMEDDGKLWKDEDEDSNSSSSKESSADESSEEASVDDDEEESRVGTSTDGNDGRKNTSLPSEKSDEIQLGNNTSNSKRASSSSTPPPASPKVRQPRVVNENFPVTPKRSNTFISASSPLGPIQSKSVTSNPKPKAPSGDEEASPQAPPQKASTPVKKIGTALAVIKNRLSPRTASVREKVNGGNSRERTESQGSDLSEEYMALEDFKSVSGPNKPSSKRQANLFSPARKLMGFPGSSIRSSQTSAASQASLQDPEDTEDKIAAANILLQLHQGFEAHKKNSDYSEAALALLQLSGRLQFGEEKIKNTKQESQAAEALLMLSQQCQKEDNRKDIRAKEGEVEAAEGLLALCRGC